MNLHYFGQTFSYIIINIAFNLILRPIESGERIIDYPQSKNVNDQNFQDIVVNSPSHYHDNYQYYYADNTVGYIPINVNSNNPNIMDGLRLQLHKRKGVSLRSPPVRRSDESQVTLRGWLYRLEGAALKQWKRRWCVLADYCLFYYKGIQFYALNSSHASILFIETFFKYYYCYIIYVNSLLQSLMHLMCT